jgi:hypothetical protein
MGKDLVGIGSDLIEVIFYFPGGTETKHEKPQ